MDNSKIHFIMSVLLNIELSKTQLPDGSWLIYYDGNDIDLDCGTYFLTVDINNEKWYSELFTVKSIAANVHPGLIYDKSHIALRFYDSKFKQDYFKCQNLCDLGVINPIDHIIPYIIDITEINTVSTIRTKIICYDGSVEYDLSDDLNYTVDYVNKIVYQNGTQLSGQLFCGIWYLQVTINETIFYSEHFKVENITNIPITNIYLYTESNTPTGFEQIVTEDGQSIILNL